MVIQLLDQLRIDVLKFLLAESHEALLQMLSLLISKATDQVFWLILSFKLAVIRGCKFLFQLSFLFDWLKVLLG